MKESLFVLQHLKRFHEKYREDELSEFTIDCDDYERINEAIAEIEALENRSCENCKWEEVVSSDHEFRCDECIHNYSHYVDNWEA